MRPARAAMLSADGDGYIVVWLRIKTLGDTRQRCAENSSSKASEIFSAIMIVGRLVLAHGIVGMSDASQI